MVGKKGRPIAYLSNAELLELRARRRVTRLKQEGRKRKHEGDRIGLIDVEIIAIVASSSLTSTSSTSSSR